MSREYRVLALGDIVGETGTARVCDSVYTLKKEYAADLILANCENAARGNGLDRATAAALFGAGIDVMTSGNHIWQKKDMTDCIDSFPFLLRPANYPAGTPGKGDVIFDSFGFRVLVMNVMGNVFLDPLACPFETVDALLRKHEGDHDLAILDIHAEATAEKLAIAYDFDGRIGIVFGTHTHVQTADTRILPGGTGYLTDLGMCGPYDSVLGVDKNLVIRKFRTKLPVRFDNPPGEVRLNGALFIYDRDARRVTGVERIDRS